MTIATEAPAPPPPAPMPKRPPNAYPVQVRTKLPLRARWSHVVTLPDGHAGTITHIWSTKKGWERRSESRDATWLVFRVGFIIVACRLDW